MFDSLQDKLTKTIRNVQGKGRLSERNMEDTLKEIRIALLESDVNY
ncbi:MAG: signal recognition particle receptor subunit alpha, partial [Erysipelotrichaceae bacterium]|nr:signal recognition particle receptor subunit alpha [Erysipelotrichaceae bacterium]